MTDQEYSVKFLTLFLSTLVCIFVIWYALIRQESADWISSEVVHQASPYVITETDGGVIINNAVLDYEFRLPKHFKVIGARNLSFFAEEAGRKKCEIRHYYINAGQAKELSSDHNKLVVLFNHVKLVFELAGTATEIKYCEKYLKQINVNLTVE